MTETSGRLPTITVGLATLDRYPYVATLLDDLAAQTHLPDEVVIVDQTAPHKRQPIPTTRWSHAFPVRVVHQETRGTTKARNQLLRECRSDIVLQADDDSRIDPDYVENHVRHFVDERVDAVTGPVYEWDAGSHEWYVKWHNHLMTGGWNGPAFPSALCLVGTNFSIRLKSALAIGGWDENILTHGEDEDFSDRLHSADAGIVFDPTLACATSGRRGEGNVRPSGAADRMATGECSLATCTTTWQTGPHMTLGRCSSNTRSAPSGTSSTVAQRSA